MGRATMEDFERVEIRVGRVVEARPFEQAWTPAYVLRIDFGDGIGVRKSSARITDRYRPDELVGRLVVAVTNFAPLQIGPLTSECRVLGFEDASGAVVLGVPDDEVPLGARLV